MGITLSFHTNKKGQGIFTIPVLWRIIFSLVLFILLVIFFQIFITQKEVSIFTALLIIVSILAVLYREVWIFDSENQTVSFLSGFGTFVRKTIFNSEQIDNLILISVYRIGKLYEGQFILQTGDKQVIIETAKKSKVEQLEKISVKAAMLVGINLEKISM